MDRSAGVLMPLSSLPSAYGIGTMGREAYAFVDYLYGAGCKVWQTLPLQPTGFGNSPYSSCCERAFNPYFNDLDLLFEDGLLSKRYRKLVWNGDARRVDYGRLYQQRIEILHEAYANFDKRNPEWQCFLQEGEYYDFAAFMTIKNFYNGAPFVKWRELAEYDRERVDAFAREHETEIGFWQFTQYLFLKQWTRLKGYANERGIKIMGDMPFYVSEDSVEMWRDKRELFALDKDGKPSVVAGVPPDAFSETGQLWGNPVYDWEKQKVKTWWRERISHALKIYDILRIDHFIGFVRYYCIPADSRDARTGFFCKGPGAELFRGMEDRPIIVEDLGIVTDEVREAVQKTGYAGMRIIQHAFDGNPDNEHKPSQYRENTVAYTGTHDNLTLTSRLFSMWERERLILRKDLKRECAKFNLSFKAQNERATARTIIKLLFASRANLVIVPLADMMLMNDEARMNYPSLVSDLNWSFRYLKRDFGKTVQRQLKELIINSKRG